MSIFNNQRSDVRYPKRTNILTTLIWLSGITFPSGAIASSFAVWPQGLLAFIVGCLPVFATLWYFKYWNEKDPDRLQTEHYRIQIEVLAKISSQDGEEIVIDNSAPLVENPSLKSGIVG